jgi:hypothetical protein
MPLKLTVWLSSWEAFSSFFFIVDLFILCMGGCAFQLGPWRLPLLAKAINKDKDVNIKKKLLSSVHHKKL